jgi:hypothetical protein
MTKMWWLLELEHIILIIDNEYAKPINNTGILDLNYNKFENKFYKSPKSIRLKSQRLILKMIWLDNS